MPVIARFDWLCAQLASGCKGHVAFSTGQMGQLKIKVLLQPGEQRTDTAARIGSVLLAARPLVQQSSTMDRGHKHTRGNVEVCFWIKPNRPSAEDVAVESAQAEEDAEEEEKREEDEDEEENEQSEEDEDEEEKKAEHSSASSSGRTNQEDCNGALPIPCYGVLRSEAAMFEPGSATHVSHNGPGTWLSGDRGRPGAAHANVADAAEEAKETVEADKREHRYQCRLCQCHTAVQTWAPCPLAGICLHCKAQGNRDRTRGFQEAKQKAKELQESAAADMEAGIRALCWDSSSGDHASSEDYTEEEESEQHGSQSSGGPSSPQPSGPGDVAASLPEVGNLEGSVDAAAARIRAMGPVETESIFASDTGREFTMVHRQHNDDVLRRDDCKQS